MKKVLISILLILSVCIQAQDSFFYQTVLRSKDGVEVAGQKINVRFSILMNGNMIYTEDNEATTDTNGYFSLYIGKGTSEKGEFSKIDWSKGKYQIKTEIDKGEGYTLAGIQELQSVPYAMQAEVAGGIQQKLSNGNTWNIVVGDDGSLIPIPYPYTKMVFHDEFNGTGLPDNSKWGYDEGWVRNCELQYYTVAREENCHQKDGNLHIVCENEPTRILNAKVNNMACDNDWIEKRKDSTITIKSACLTTPNKHYWKYCRIDVRAKLPKCLGSWPAIWMMPQFGSKGWPFDGEIDIMEHVGYDPNKVYFTLHYEAENGAHKMHHGDTSLPTSYTEFHVYSFEWREGSFTWYIDGKKKCVMSKTIGSPESEWPFNKEFYLMLNLAFGGGWGGQLDKGQGQIVELDKFPLDYQIDYVRVYQ